jgi:oligoendopeptidase F
MKVAYPIHCLAALLCVGILPAAQSAADPVIPDYSQSERSEVPDEFKFRVEDLFVNEAAWRTEFDAFAKLVASVDQIDKDWTRTPSQVVDMLDLIGGINERGERLASYANLRGDMELANPVFAKMQAEFKSVAVDFGAKTTFVTPDILKLGQEKVSAYLVQEPRLARYRFPLERILRNKDHSLSEAEASIVAQVQLFTDTAPKVSGLLNDVDIPPAEVTMADGSKAVLNTYNFLKYRQSKNPSDRRVVAEAYWNNLRKYENSFAALLDGEMKKQVAFARIHKFSNCLEATLFENNIDPDVYRNVIKTVRANLTPLHRFFKLKQRMLGLKELRYYDVYAHATKSIEKPYSYQESQKLIVAAMAPLGAEYAKGLKRAFDERWIDLYPNKGKQSGGYSAGVYGVHPYIKMNYSGRYDDVSVLAHELGHTMHSLFSNESQPYATAEYSIFIAEIASTFNENLLLNESLRTSTDDAEKLMLLESYLDRVRGTVYAQTMHADFELTIHEHVEQGLPLTAPWLKATWLEKFNDYMGTSQGVMTEDKTMSIQWAAIPHFFRPYYMFQYVTGMVASSALAEVVTHGGEAEAKSYQTLLRAGGSKYALDILRDAGVDMAKPEPIEAAIRRFDQLVTEMETLYARLPKDAR